LTFCHAIPVIQAKDLHRNARFGSERSDYRTFDHEVIGPCLLPWVEERHEVAGRWIEGPDIRPFVSIAPQARQRQIIFLRVPAVLTGDNMVWLVSMCASRLGQAAILAAVTRTLCD